MSKSRKSSRSEVESKRESRLAELARELLRETGVSSETSAPSEKEKARLAVWNNESKTWTRYAASSHTSG